MDNSNQDNQRPISLSRRLFLKHSALTSAASLVPTCYVAVDLIVNNSRWTPFVSRLNQNSNTIQKPILNPRSLQF